MWGKIKSFFIGVGSFIFRFAKTNSGVLVEEIGDVAYAVVKNVELKAGPNDNKFEMAKAELILELGGRAPKYAEYILNKAIEMAHGLLVDNGEERKK